MVKTKKYRYKRKYNIKKRNSKIKKRLSLNQKNVKSKKIKKIKQLGGAKTGKDALNMFQSITTQNKKWTPKDKKECHRLLFKLSNLDNKSNFEEYLDIRQKLYRCLPKDAVENTLPFLMAVVENQKKVKDVKEQAQLIT